MVKARKSPEKSFFRALRHGFQSAVARLVLIGFVDTGIESAQNQQPMRVRDMILYLWWNNTTKEERTNFLFPYIWQW